MIFEGKTTDDGAREWDELAAAADEVDGAHMDIGWHADDEKHPGSEYTVAEIAAVHEFGTKPGTVPAIPERSTLRSTTDDQDAAWRRREDRAFSRISDGKDPLTELTAVGELASSDVKRKITTLRDPPNAESTIDRKGSSNPLIDTGFMRAAVHSRIVVDGRESRTEKS